ncbi:glycoside hydrolase family 28 protein [Phenylobacterium hankyongense]|uniref:Glycoside hydrolase family 28 protein n=1 Tax=Phenylobacterium hankyongense TaxID=1813876 RepID=A0A328AXF5_9CAUL|nr:glycosyl hydrolase family 28 protein [Phenylobacterium hankyongense]RAK58945.1 glycoside hydrolase family 28 protein [Phenylobacterium hankyongense]
MHALEAASLAVLGLLLIVPPAAAAPPPRDGLCNALAYGARGDGKTLDTRAIQKAVDVCAGHGGGVVVLPQGVFLSGTIVLRDRITLRIMPGAVLAASPRIEDFRPFPPEDVAKIAIDGSTQNKGNGPYHLIHVEGAHDVAIDGGGEIRGNGAAYWDRAADGALVSRRPRPTPLIETVASRGVRIENVTITGAAGWTVHPLESDGVVIRDVRIFNDPLGPNTDGIDIDSSRNVIVSDVHVEAGDDCVVLKTTGRRGGKVAATENVLVSNLVCSSDDQGFKIGTESLGDFRNITLNGATIFQAPGFYRPPTTGIAMSMVDGASFENVIVSNVVIRDAHTPLFLRLGNRGRGQPVPVAGRLRHVIFSNIVATGGDLASSITGLRDHPVEDVTLSDISITMKGGERSAPAGPPPPEADGAYPHAPMFGPLPAHGLYVRHVRGLTLRNVRLMTEEPDARPSLVTEDVERADNPTR